MKKGPKYRPPSKIDWKECRQVTKDALSSFCKKWCKREKSDKKSLDSYLSKCMNVEDKRISHFKNNLEVNNRVHNTPISRIRNKLQILSKRFVFVPADKAANNVVVVCRKYYTDVLKNEILNSSTFKSIRSTESHIVNKHITSTSKFKASSACEGPYYVLGT